jgi:FtsP/CotA-like multicopper oxidase with cupredoxin domain
MPPGAEQQHESAHAEYGQRQQQLQGAAERSSASTHGSGHPQSGMGSGATRPQLAAVAGLSLLALLIGMIAPANFVNLRLSARQVGGLIMPPGMITLRDTPAESMREMAAVHPPDITHVAEISARGDQPLEASIEGGVKVFRLELSVIRWFILPDVYVDAFAVNGQVPGPRIRLTQGDRVRIHVRNGLPESSTVHWYGLILPNEMDGPAKITQAPIPRRGTYV